MLARLIVTNFKLIEELDLDFDYGAFAVTGETGAGKSSLLQALAAALGAKMQGTALRPGAQRGEVQAWFDLKDHPHIRSWLADKDFPATEEHQCVLRRTFSADGRSRAQINGSACPIGNLTEVGEMLADLISQNQHHSLLRPQAQFRLLDDSWDSRETLQQLGEGYHRIDALKKSIAQVRADSEGGDEQCEFLEQQMQQLAELELAEGSFEECEQEYRQLAGAGDTMGLLDGVEILLQRESGSVEERLQNALKQLPDSTGDKDPLRAVREHVHQAAEQVNEAISAIRLLARELDNSPQRLAELEKQISDCHQLARRHHCDPKDLWRMQAQWQKQLEQLQGAEATVREMEQQLDEEQKAWLAAAREVSESRTQAAQLLAAEVNKRLDVLGMPGAEFSVRLSPAEPSVRGLEQAAFRYTPARAVADDDLGRIASGGELSRLYLALCLGSLSLHARSDNLPPLLVLDEVDTGIGGKTAHRLADLMRQLGESRQVLYITHLAQVAAAAHRHLRVTRSQQEQEQLPTLSVDLLPEQERREELARMLGGGRAGRESRELADKLLQAAANP